MGDKKNVIHQGGKLLHAPSMQLSQYLYSRKGGHNFLHRVKPPKELKRNASRASQSQERGIDTSENNGGTGADSPRDSKRNSNRNLSRSGSRAGSRAGSRTGSRAGSMDHGDASELGQHVTQIRRIHSKQSGAEQSLEVLPVRSESTVVWAWILMSLIIYVFGLVFYRALKPDICPGGIAEEDQMLATYFGSLSLSVFSVFQLTTLEDWPDVSEVISKYQSWLGVMVVLLLLLTAYGVMNVTVAIFVNSAMDASSVRSRDIAKKAKEEYEATCKSLYQVFNDADNDGNGSLSKDEFEKAIYEKKLLARLHGAGIDVASAAQLFDILDIDNSGTLDGNEFVEGVLRSRGYAQNKDLVGLRCDVWRANLSVQEEIRLVNLYFEERLQETKQKLETLKEVAGPVLQRAQEDGRKKPVLKKGRSGQGLAVVIGGTESTEEHDGSISFGGRPSGGSGHALQSLPISIFTPS